MDNKEFKTIKEIAKMYNVSVQAVYNWQKIHNIKSKVISGATRLNIKDIEAIRGSVRIEEESGNIDSFCGTGETLTNQDLVHQNELLKQKIEYLETLNHQLKDYNLTLENQNGFLIYEISEYKNKIKSLEAPKEEVKESFFTKLKNIFKKD